MKTKTISKNILSQAGPILISQWTGLAYGFFDSVMLGKVNPNALQTMSLAVSVYLTVSIGLMGVIHALIPILSQFYGAKQYRKMGYYWGQGVLLALVLSVIGSIVMLFPDAWLALSGNIDPEVREQIKIYLYISCFALPANLIFRTIHAFCATVQKNSAIMRINLISVALKLGLNWILISGQLGMPALNASGAAIATCICSWFTFGYGLYMMRTNVFYKKFHCNFTLKPNWNAIKNILNVGIPMGGSYLVEVSAFTFMAFLTAREGALVSGGHLIMANFSGISYMPPLSIGMATAALAAQALGAQNPQLAKKIGYTGIKLGLATAISFVLFIYFFSSNVVDIYTNNAEIKYIALGLFALIPFFHIFDALQCLLAYILRAYKVTFLPFIFQAIVMLGVGLIGGWFFGYGPMAGFLQWLSNRIIPDAPIGVFSMWIMTSLSLFICTLIMLYLYRKTLKKFNQAFK